MSDVCQRLPSVSVSPTFSVCKPSSSVSIGILFFRFKHLFKSVVFESCFWCYDSEGLIYYWRNIFVLDPGVPCFKAFKLALLHWYACFLAKNVCKSDNVSVRCATNLVLRYFTNLYFVIVLFNDACCCIWSLLLLERERERLPPLERERERERLLPSSPISPADMYSRPYMGQRHLHVKDVALLLEFLLSVALISWF